MTRRRSFGVAARDMKRAAVHSRTATLPAQFGDVLREMNLKLMELNLLLYGRQGITTLNDFISNVNEILEAAKELV